MERLVYSPKVSAYIQTDDGILDITDYIVSGNIQRVVNEVSTAELVIRNPNKKFTRPGNPTFRPMDSITIYGSRFKDRPVQLFTGYLDETPYLQLFPGTCSLQASCTLKRLLYTYFDPGLSATIDFLKKYNWVSHLETGQIRSPKSIKEQTNHSAEGDFTDGSVGKLMFATLNEIGNWNANQIFIEDFPKDAGTIVQAMLTNVTAATDEAEDELKGFLADMVGEFAVGGGSGSSADATGLPGWHRVGATYEGLAGHTGYRGGLIGGMNFAELLVAGDNAGLWQQDLASVLGFPNKQGEGMPNGTKIQIRMPGASKYYEITKNDIGSGQGGSSHYKIDLQDEIVAALGFHGEGDVEVRNPDAIAGKATGKGWHPDAERVQVSDGYGDMLNVPGKIVWHTVEGNGLPTYSGDAPHFTLNPQTGKLYQHIPITSAAGSLVHGSVETNKANAIQTELMGFASQTQNWSDVAYTHIASLARWIETNAGVARACSVRFGGLNNLPPRLSDSAWLRYSGHCGHQHVPGNEHWDPGEFKIQKVI